MYRWDFSFIGTYSEALLTGLLNTLLITCSSVLLGSALSLIVVAGQVSQIRFIRYVFRFYVEFFIALPVLVLLVWIYYCLPSIGFKTSSLWTAVFALSLSLSAFLAELVRGAIAAVPRGQIEAAKLLRISRRQIASKIIAPQVFRIIGPALLNEYVATLKLSTIASIISAPELLYQSALIISQSYHPLETYTALAVLFALIIIPLLRISRLIEGRRQWTS
jgi:polar amino acid transport system permease protein